MAAYWIAHVTVGDNEQYQRYMALAPAAFQRFNARFIARGGKAETLEGESFARHVVIEFPDMATALACYHSPEYRLAREARQGAAEVAITIVDGLNA